MTYPPPPPPPTGPNPAVLPVTGQTTTPAQVATIPAVLPKPRINVRNKGQRGEREVVQLLQSVVDKIRGKHNLEPLVLQRNALQAHLGGADLHGLDGFAVEVKFCETECLNQWWKQCCQQADKIRSTAHRDAVVVPVLFYRATRQAWTVKFRAFVQTPLDVNLIEMDVEVSLEDFMQWFEDAYEEQTVLRLHTL